MASLDFLEADELLQFFRRHKTELSCMENPRTFLNQLRDHNLIPEDRYKRMIRMRSNENMRQTLYEVLDWLEREQSQHIKLFWTCVFKEPIMVHYPTLRTLRNSLMDGYAVEDERETDSVKKKRKQRSSSVLEEEQASTSSQSIPGQRRKSKRIFFSSHLKKGQKKDIWTWPLWKSQLPVTCGKAKGILNRDKLAKGEKCIMHKNRWFTPNQFERIAGKRSCKNWKLSIRCLDTPLRKLLQEGHLNSAKSKRECKTATKPRFPSDDSTPASEGESEDENEESDPDKEDRAASSSKESSTGDTDREEEMEEQTEQQPQASHGGSKKVFKVTCGTSAGTLHQQRFASGTLGKSIRTEVSWMTPVEFMETALRKRDASWRKHITYEGKPLAVLIEDKVLMIHSPLCPCPKCKPDADDLEDQKNDDECFVCRSDRQMLVVCDHCPRSFHQYCHLPHIEDAIIGESGPWMCTFCEYRNKQEDSHRFELERTAAMSHEISQHMLECQYLLLCLCGADEQQTFATNPSLYLQVYSTVIETHMWLGNIADKLQRQLYQTVGEFVSDVQLIFTNCASHNQENAAVLAEGDRLKKLFDNELKNVFNICD